MSDRPQAFERIFAAVRATRARLRLRAALVAGGWGLTAAAGVALAVVLAGAAGLEGSAWRALGPALVAAAGLGTGGWRLWREMAPYRRDEAVAAHLERGLPEMRDGLIACVQFGREWDRLTAGSPALVAALAEDVARRLRGRDLAPLTPLTAARRPWTAVAAVAGLWGLMGLLAPGLLARGFAALRPVGTAADGTPTGPLVGDLHITLHYPEHTGREPRVIPNSSGDIEAPKGTRIALEAVTLEPARAVALRFGDEEGERPLALSEGRRVSGEFVLTKAGPWRFVIVTEAGETLVEAIDRRLRIEEDRAPTVRLEVPAEDMELEDLRDVPVRWEATDDFGMTRGAIVIGLAVDPEHPERVAQPGVSGTRVRGEDEVDLSVIQAKPGDRIALFVEVYDNNSVDGPQRGVSATRYITVRSPEAKHFELARKLRESIEALLVALADRLEVDFRADPPALPRIMSGLAARTEEAIKLLDEVVVGMADDPLTPKEVRLALAGRLGELERAFDVEKALVERLGLGPDQPVTDPAIRGVSRQNEQVVEKLEETIILVEAMVARLALEDVMAMTEELRVAREELRALIEAYRENPDPALKARIMRDIQRLRERMREIRARMAELRQKLPEEFLNLDGMKRDEVAKGLHTAEDQLEALEKMLEEGKIDEALAALDEMSQVLEELDAALNEDLDDLHAETNPELQRAISELMDQTRDLMKRQEELGRETQEMADAVDEARRKALEEKLEEKLAAINERAQRLRQIVEQVDPRAMPSYREEELDTLRQRVDDLNAALRRMDLLEAFDMARSALDHLDALERAGRYDPPQAGEQDNRSLLLQGQALDRLIIRDLAELLEEAQQQARQAADPQQMQQLTQEQRELAESARKLRQRIAEQRQQMPAMSPETERRAGNAAEAMEQSGEHLRRQRPGQARAGQQEAVSELRGLMEGLKQSLKPQRANRDGQQQRGRRVSREKVRIPGAEEYQAPAEFRQELLDAMKDKPPEEYREEVKRYYESLVR